MKTATTYRPRHASTGKKKSFLDTKLPRNPFAFATVRELILGTIAFTVSIVMIVTIALDRSSSSEREEPTEGQVITTCAYDDLTDEELQLLMNPEK